MEVASERTMWVNTIIGLVGAKAAKKRYALPELAADYTMDEFHEIARALLQGQGEERKEYPNARSFAPRNPEEVRRFGEYEDFEEYYGDLRRKYSEESEYPLTADEEDPDYIPGF